MDTDAFDLNEVFNNAPLDEDTVKQDEKLKKRIEKRSKVDREEQRRINREKRQLKKDAREKNKKRKRGEEVSDDENEEEKKGEEGEEEEKQPKDTKKQKVAKKEKVVEYGVWVGNLAFRTTREQLTKFFSDCGTVTRLKCPKGQGKNNNKGFAYVMFATQEEADKAVAKSEQKIDARALLIKPADNFERKDGLTVKEVKKQKNPPCATLFIGNLPFDATKEGLREAFEECGDIMNVRLGTFEDTGKCKGFGYVDFETVEDATKAIRATNKHVLNGQKLRVEFGSEEAYRRGRPWLGRADKRAAEKSSGGNKQQHHDEEAPAANENYDKPQYDRPRREKRVKSEKKPSSNQRVAPGMALSQAQRQKPTVQAFQGTKVTFD